MGNNRRFFGIILVSVVTLLFSIPAVSASSPPEPNSNARIKTVAYLNEGFDNTGNTALERPEQFSTLVVNRFAKPDQIQRWKSLGIRTLVYINGSHLNGDDMGPNGNGDGTPYPEAAYAHFARPFTPSTRISPAQYPNNYLMNPRNRIWARSLVAKCEFQIRNLGVDGCNFDTIGAAPILPGYETPAPPLDPRTNQTWTTEDWLRAMSRHGKRLKRALPNAQIWGNGLGRGNLYFNQNTKLLLDSFDAVLAERFLKEPMKPVRVNEEAWKQDVDMLVDGGSQGKAVITATKIWDEQTPAVRQQAKMFSFTSYLLGSNTKSQYSFQGSHSQTSPSEYDDIWATKVGSPRNNYYKTDVGLYRRDFANAITLVNPTDQVITFTLERSYRNLVTREVSNRITLGSNEGALLMRR